MSAFTLTEGIAVLLLAAGLFFILAAVIGILRLPDFFTRLHAMGKCDTVGLSLSLLGLALLADDPAVTVKLLLVWPWSPSPTRRQRTPWPGPRRGPG